MSETALRVEKVSHIRDNRTILDNVSFTVNPREFFAIVGPSGCGKSVLLRVIAGLERPATGSVWIEDQDVTDLPAEKHQVPIMFQSFALFPHMDVYNNVAYGPRRRGYREDEIAKRIHWALNLVRLTGFEKRKIQTLSGGQKQRVALARSLAPEASILMFDDPFAALDANLRVSMQTELKNIHKEVGITFLHVTSDQGEAMALADRIAVMNNGQLDQVGTASELLSSPKTIFVAKFFGRNSILEGEVRAIEKDGVVIQTPAGEITAQYSQRRYDKGTSVGVVVPVDCIVLQREGEDTMSGFNHLRGVISDIHFSSGVFTLWIATACKRPMQVEVKDDQFHRKPFEKGHSVIINWLPAESSVAAET